MKIILCLAILLGYSFSFSQDKNDESDEDKKNVTILSREVGQYIFSLSANSILEPISSKTPMLPFFDAQPDGSGGNGGSFDSYFLSVGAGYAFKFEDFRLPITIEYTNFSAKETRRIRSAIKQTYENNVDILALSASVEWPFWHINDDAAFLYLGAGPDLNYIFNRDFTADIDYVNSEGFPDRNDVSSKDDVFRLGGRFTLGMQGTFKGLTRFNIFSSLLAYNLINEGEDGTRLFDINSALPNQNEAITIMARIGVSVVILDKN
ncbi:MAG: hypothetical protein Kapaf2KO_03460 [Candidatus Kapaibacteriales bacterium]